MCIHVHAVMHGRLKLNTKFNTNHYHKIYICIMHTASVCMQLMHSTLESVDVSVQ